MNEMTRIVLIRHGETEWNLSGRWQGHANSSLTTRGIAQAEALGKRMVDETIDHVYCSDLERAEHTARLVGGPSGWQPTLSESLRERDLGVLEGLTTTEMLEQFPQEYRSFCEGGPEYRIPEGESFKGFYDRCSGAMEDLANKHPGSRIAIVTHGGFLGTCLRYVLGIPLELTRNYALLNCSINRLNKTEDGWQMISWGDVTHLQGLKTLDDAKAAQSSD